MRPKLCTIFTIATYLLCISTHGMDERVVVACDFSVISKNDDTSKIISHAVASARQILSCFYLSYISPWRLCSTIAHLKKRGDEIALTTPGITNTIKKLFTELEEQEYGKFTDTAINCFNEMGVNPVPDHEAMLLLSRIKSFKIPTIIMGNQDSREHEIFARKLLTDHHIDLHELFDGVATIATLEEQATLESSTEDYFVRKTSHPRWYVSRQPAPSPSFTQTIKMLAKDMFEETPIWSVNSKQQLAIIVNALHSIDGQRTKSPEQGKMSEGIFQRLRVISPTKV